MSINLTGGIQTGKSICLLMPLWLAQDTDHQWQSTFVKLKPSGQVKSSVPELHLVPTLATVKYGRLAPPPGERQCDVQSKLCTITTGSLPSGASRFTPEWEGQLLQCCQEFTRIALRVVSLTLGPRATPTPHPHPESASSAT